GCEGRDWYADPPDQDHERTQDPRSHLCDMAFNLFEEVYYQRHKFRLLDDEDWRGWWRMIQALMGRRYAKAYWPVVRSYYSEPFARAVDAISGGESPPRA